MKAVFYAQFDKKSHIAARLVTTSQGPPRTLQGQVVVKVELEIPRAAFEPLTAQGVIEAGFVGIPIMVETGDIEPLVDRWVASEDEDEEGDGEG